MCYLHYFGTVPYNCQLLIPLRSECPRVRYEMRSSRPLLGLVASLIFLVQLAPAQNPPSEGIANWEPVVEEPIFPAVILSTTTLHSKPTNGILGDAHSVARILIKPSVANAR